MSKVIRIGVDLGKTVFQVHGVDDGEEVVLRRKLRRGEMKCFFAALAPCLVGLEACATAHYWARELTKLGHTVRLLPPSYVKAYVKRGKNDAIDAEAICEALSRPSMRFVPVKSVEQQTVLVVHRTRALLVRQRTMLANALRGHLGEFGFVAAKGINKLLGQFALLADSADDVLPAPVRRVLGELVEQLGDLDERIGRLDRQILAWHKADPESRRLATIPGVGPITASAIVASLAEPGAFRSGRHLAAWLGLTPRQSSSGGKQQLGGVSKMGNRYLRTLLVLGATSMVRQAQRSKAPQLAWIAKLLERKPARLVTLALANKTARIIWAIWVSGQTYQPRNAA